MRRAFSQFVGSMLLALGLSPGPAAWADSLAPLDERITQLSEQYNLQQRGISDVSAELDRLSERISRLKKEQRRKPGWLQGLRLESALKDAKVVSDRLESLKTDADRTDRELSETRSALADAIDAEIARRRTVAGRTGAPLELRRTAALDVERLLYRRMHLALEVPGWPLSADVARLPDLKSNPEATAAKLDAVRDFERRLLKELDSINQEITALRRQAFVRNEVLHLMDEESFFAEQSFVRAGAPRTNRTPDEAKLASSAEAKSGETAAPAAGAPSPAVSPVSVSPSTPGTESGLPAAQPAAGVVTFGRFSPAAGTEDPAGSAARDRPLLDPLLVLARELGVETKDLESRSPGSTGGFGGTLQWLETRRRATQAIVKKLQEFARILEDLRNK